MTTYPKYQIIVIYINVKLNSLNFFHIFGDINMNADINFLIIFFF
jgi:hypothetical protein